MGPNVARQVAHRAGIQQEAPAFTVNMACGSGLKSIELAYRATPYYGEHNFELYGELLGMDEIEVAEHMGDGLFT